MTLLLNLRLQTHRFVTRALRAEITDWREIYADDLQQHSCLKDPTSDRRDSYIYMYCAYILDCSEMPKLCDLNHIVWLNRTKCVEVPSAQHVVHRAITA